MKKIAIGKNGKSGLFALVDDEDYERLKKMNWYCNNGGYVIGRRNRKYDYKFMLMHRLIMNTPKNMDTDHINHNKLDNRKSNLRICTVKENMGNQRKIRAGTSSKYKGVCLDKYKGTWRSYIIVSGRHIYLGRHQNEIDAAKAYNKAAKKYFKKFALLNKF